MPNIEKLKKKQNVKALIELLLNNKITIRVEAVKALIDLKDLKGLKEALKNDSSHVRIEAILGLEKFEEDDAIQYIKDSLCFEKEDEVWQQTFEVMKRVINRKGMREDITDFWLKIGSTTLKEKNYNHALKIFERAVEIKPEKETYGSISAILLDNGLHNECLSYSEEIIKIDPNDERGWGTQGAALFNLKQFEEAEKCFEKALNLNPKYNYALDMLGAIYYHNNDYDALQSLARRKLQNEPEDIKSHIMLSETFASSNQLNDAESCAKKALEIEFKKDYVEAEDLGMIYQQLGILYTMKGHKDEAYEHFIKAIEANKNDDWYYKLLSAYNILNIIGSAMEGSPLERRARLLGLAEKRDPGVSRKDYYDIIGM